MTVQTTHKRKLLKRKRMILVWHLKNIFRILCLSENSFIFKKFQLRFLTKTLKHIEIKEKLICFIQFLMIYLFFSLSQIIKYLNQHSINYKLSSYEKRTDSFKLLILLIMVLQKFENKFLVEATNKIINFSPPTNEDYSQIRKFQ